MKPILFNSEMVRAILDDRKTATRRVIKPQPLFFTGRKYIFADDEIPKKWKDCDDFVGTYQYQPGDILYVRETFGYSAYAAWDGITYYRADADDETERIVKAGSGWRPSIHMPKEAARIFLRVNKVRVEQLQDIDEDGVIAEGAEPLIVCSREHGIYYPEGGAEMCWNVHTCSNCPIFKSYPELFGEKVWNRTVKSADLSRYGWDANPFVWVTEFERISKEEAQS